MGNCTTNRSCDTGDISALSGSLGAAPVDVANLWRALAYCDELGCTYEELVQAVEARHHPESIGAQHHEPG